MEKTFLQTKKVMLVDDEPDLLKMVSAILADCCCRHRESRRQRL